MEEGEAARSRVIGMFMLVLTVIVLKMCAIKEVTLFSDDAKSKESAKHLGQVPSSKITCRVKLADFGMITKADMSNCPLSFKGSPNGWHLRSSRTATVPTLQLTFGVLGVQFWK